MVNNEQFYVDVKFRSIHFLYIIRLKNVKGKNSTFLLLFFNNLLKTIWSFLIIMEYLNLNRSVHVYMYSYLYTIIYYILGHHMFNNDVVTILLYALVQYCTPRTVKLLIIRTLKVVRNCIRTIYILIYMYNKICSSKTKNIVHIFEFSKHFI